MNKENSLHDIAWSILEEAGLSLSKRMIVRSNFSEAYKKEHPNIETKHKKEELQHYYSSHKEISGLMFRQKSEVILANAIYENLGENININEFHQTLKYVFRVIGIQNEWT